MSLRGMRLPRSLYTGQAGQGDAFDPGDPYTERGALAKPWLTWGNSYVFSFPGNMTTPVGETNTPTGQSTQILNVKYEMPTTWSLRVVFDFAMQNGENAPVTVQYLIQTGVGQALVKVLRTFVVNAPYAQLVNDEQFPAEGIQLQGAVFFNPTIIPTPPANDTVTLTAMVAPVFT